MSTTKSDIEKQMKKALEHINKKYQTHFQLTFHTVPKEIYDNGLPQPNPIAFLKYPDGSEDKEPQTEQEMELAERYKKVQDRSKMIREYSKYY